MTSFSENSSSKPKTPIHILVVEDSRTQAEEISYFLEVNHYNVHTCMNGEEAKEWLENCDPLPNVVVSDVVMPKMDGYELCKYIRNHPKLKNIPVTLLTSLSEPQDIIRSIEAGANKFLTKPINPERLVDVIEELHINTLRRSTERMEMGIRLVFGGTDFLITADKVQILDLLLSSYEESYYQNLALRETRTELEQLNSNLELKVQARTAEIKQREEQFRTLAQNIPDLIIRTHRDYTISYVNDALERFFGIAPQAIIGQSIQNLSGLNHECPCVATIKQVFATEKQVRKELCSPIPPAKDCSVDQWFDMTFVPEYNGESDVQSVLIVARDITQRKQMEHSLHEQEQIMLAQSKHAAMGEMIGMIAHQWRQPITVIAMGANNIIADIDLENADNDTFRHQASNILLQTDYLSKTIEDFRNFFRPHKDRELIQVESILDESLQIIGKSLEHSHIKVALDAPATPAIMTYSRELMQVFINLIKNAKEALIEHRDSHRQIQIKISHSDTYIRAEICDNAGGIPESIMTRIYDPYFSTKDETVGTGLGLYMSKTIIEKHLQGSIEAKNTEDGACFVITLPTEQQQDD